MTKKIPPNVGGISFVVVDIVERLSHTYFFGAMFVFRNFRLGCILIEWHQKRKHNNKNNNSRYVRRDETKGCIILA
jgi:hypothetical protein